MLKGRPLSPLSVARYWWILTCILTMKRVGGTWEPSGASPIGCLGQLAGVSKVVLYPPPPAMPLTGFAHLRH
jgi:hypothetical protein